MVRECAPCHAAAADWLRTASRGRQQGEWEGRAKFACPECAEVEGFHDSGRLIGALSGGWVRETTAQQPAQARPGKGPPPSHNQPPEKSAHPDPC